MIENLQSKLRRYNKPPRRHREAGKRWLTEWSHTDLRLVVLDGRRCGTGYNQRVLRRESADSQQLHLRQELWQRVDVINYGVAPLGLARHRLAIALERNRVLTVD